MGKGAAICRLGGIGDNLIVSSTLPLLREKYGWLEVITQPPQSAIFENNPHIARLSERPRNSLPQDGMAWQKWFTDRAIEYDFFCNLSHSVETMVALTQGQTQFYWPTAFRQQYCGVNYLERVHDIVGVPHQFNPRFYPTLKERDRAAETKCGMGNTVIGWCLAGSRLDKVYPPSALAIARLIRELGVSVVMFGSPGRDFEGAKIILQHVTDANGSHQGLHLALSPDPENPSWPIRRMLTQIGTCDLVIGPDTGAMWSVAMEDMPKVMLLSHASAENITKHWRNTTTLHADPKRVPCWPCHQLHETPETCRPNAANNGAACISDIGVEMIVATARRLLQTGIPYDGPSTDLPRDAGKIGALSAGDHRGSIASLCGADGAKRQRPDPTTATGA